MHPLIPSNFGTKPKNKKFIVFCGICRTDIHIAEGDLRLKKSPLVLGHEIVGGNDSGEEWKNKGTQCSGKDCG